MKCLYCTTDLPVDSNTNHVTCPKCGSEFDVKILWSAGNNDFAKTMKVEITEPNEHPTDN